MCPFEHGRVLSNFRCETSVISKVFPTPSTGLPSTVVLMIVTCLMMQGCADVPVYKRGNLAKPEMAWSPDPMEAALQKHIYFAKEASSGGAEAAGGGCGCN